MARIYAAILGPLALVTVLVDGLLHARPPHEVAWQGWFSLVAFAAVGLVVGHLADQTVHESVAAMVAAELESRSGEAEAEPREEA